MPTSKHSGTGTSMFKMLASSAAKQKFQLKDHQFLLQPVLLTVHCYQCREVFWGVNPQAYFCQNRFPPPHDSSRWGRCNCPFIFLRCWRHWRGRGHCFGIWSCQRRHFDKTNRTDLHLWFPENETGQQFLCATISSVSYQIQFTVHQPSTQIVPFELANEKTKEKLKLIKASVDDWAEEDRWVMKRCQNGEMAAVQWAAQNLDRLNTVEFHYYVEAGIGPLSPRRKWCPIM
ncbi:hypothetical protein niasHS_005524 [Heterodera schachtii]|uniref:Uncharacterized protein n=1 Tax=Heterodera schachtii TaxID=97005 RepID=A0ABD2JMP6_HETSC